MVLGGPNGGMTIPLSERPVTLGRTWDSDILVDESTVSRRHALIMETSAGFILRDLNSTNGTFVGHDKMGQAERPLKNGDRIRLAGSQITFIFRQERPATVGMMRESPTSQLDVVWANSD